MITITLWTLRENLGGEESSGWSTIPPACMHNSGNLLELNIREGSCAISHDVLRCLVDFWVTVWFELVDSNSDVADGIKRNLHEDSFNSKLGVALCKWLVHTWLWSDL